MEGTLASSLSFDRNHGFSAGTIFKSGGGERREGGRGRDGNDGSANFSLAGSGVCSRPVEKFSEFVHEREPEKRQWDRDWMGEFRLVFFFCFLFFCFFRFFFFLPDFSEMILWWKTECGLRYQRSKTLVPPESKHTNVQSELRQQTII